MSVINLIFVDDSNNLWIWDVNKIFILITELAQLSGIAAHLRFPMPELEDEDDNEDENDSDDNDSDN